LNASSVGASAPGAGARGASRDLGSEAAAKASSGPGVAGEVLQQDVPDASPKARASIHGKVKVSVKVHVDQSGNITGAEFVSAGSSKYFADLAMKSARKWEFAPAKLNGQYVASDWILRYEFSNSGTKVFPQQTSR
jgi:TonB family protein